MYRNWKDLVTMAENRGFTVTSTIGGTHNNGSAHYKGLAIDVRTWNKTEAECEAFIRFCREMRLIVRDERKRPQHQKVWSGPHIHVEIVAA
jgi:hypothetical protein